VFTIFGQWLVTATIMVVSTMLVVTATCGAPLFPRLTPATSTSTRLAPTSTATTGLTAYLSAASVIGLRKKEFVFFLFLFLVFS
jgi:hypothetical protein